jgi:hypothetical protein
MDYSKICFVIMLFNEKKFVDERGKGRRPAPAGEGRPGL